MRAFHSDNPKARTKQKELTIHQALQKAGAKFDYQLDILFAGCGLGSETRWHAYADFVITKPCGYIVLEVDVAARS